MANWIDYGESYFDIPGQWSGYEDFPVDPPSEVFTVSPYRMPPLTAKAPVVPEKTPEDFPHLRNALYNTQSVEPDQVESIITWAAKEGLPDDVGVFNTKRGEEVLRQAQRGDIETTATRPGLLGEGYDAVTGGAGKVRDFLGNTSVADLLPTILTAGMPFPFLPTIGQALGDVTKTFTDPLSGIGYGINSKGELVSPTPDVLPGYEEAFRPTETTGDIYQRELLAPTQPQPLPTAQPAPFNRSAALDQLIADTIANTQNPGIADAYFNDIIKTGILGRSEALGPDVTQQQFELELGSSRLGQELLGEETGRLRDVFAGEVGSAFPGGAFDPITDDDIINDILSEQRGTALGQIARFGGAGNLSEAGGAIAGQAISGGEPTARTRLEDIGSSVRGLAQRDIDALRGEASERAETFELGDPFFDIAPFTAERQEAIGARDIGGEIREQLGAEQLFDPQAAISQAAKGQGLVSGGPSFLDQVAARSGSASRRKRGIGSRGSGVF